MVLATLLECTLIYQQQPDDEAREELHDYAWAALQLLVEEGCVELVRPPSPPTNKMLAASTTAAAETDTVEGTGSTRGAGAVVHRQEESLPELAVPASKRQKVVGAQHQGVQALPVRVAAGTTVPLPSRGRDRGLQEVKSAGGGGGGGGGCGGSGGGGARDAGGGSRGEDDWLLVPTKLGMAIFRSSMPPGDGLMVYRGLSGECLSCVSLDVVSL